MSPSFAWIHESLIRDLYLGAEIPDTKTHFQGETLNSSMFRDDVQGGIVKNLGKQHSQ